MQIIQVYQTKSQKTKNKKEEERKRGKKNAVMKVLGKIASLFCTRINHNDKFR